jgi:hypothetical protein
MIEFNTDIDKNFVLASVNQGEVFKKYIDNLTEFGKLFCSELRSDNNPTCSVVDIDAYYIYKDFATGDTYNCISYVMVKFNYSEQEALRVICADFKIDLSNEYFTPVISLDSIKRKVKKKHKDIKIKSRPFTKEDLDYWYQYGIVESDLAKFNIKSLEYYWIEGHRFKVKSGELCFAYCFGNYTYKIYQPYDENYKWISNTTDRVLQGYNELPFEDELLIITSSLKDVVTLSKLGYIAVAPASEVSYIPDDIMKELKIRFNKIMVYFNNDIAGILGANNYKDKYGLDFIHHSIDILEKDPSDYVKSYGLNKLDELMLKMLNI